MKAILHCEYGGPEVLTVEDVEKPVPNDNQVLVRVRAASVNPLDLTIRGPWLLRPLSGLRKPKDTRLGVDYAGTVEAVGKNVTNFKPGDEVFGGKTGAIAEYICVLADRAVTPKPANMTFEQAASVPVAAITALQGLRDKGKIQRRAKGPDQRRVGRRGHVRGADREIIRDRSDRRMQHAQCRSCPINRRRPRH